MPEKAWKFSFLTLDLELFCGRTEKDEEERKMKRRLAWFMAVLMCVTGVPQGTFLSMAAEDNLTETETLQAEESEENISLTAETEDRLRLLWLRQ